MSKLVISREELPRLETAMETLSSPLDYESVDRWRRAVNRMVGDLVGADQRTFLLPLEGVDTFFSEEIPSEVTTRYGEILLPLDRRLHIQERALRAGVSNRKTTWGPHLSYFYRSAYYNDFLVPIRAFDNLTALATIGSGAAVAQLLLHHERRRGRRFGSRGQKLLRLLLPAFRAGVRTMAHLHAQRRELGAVLDRVPHGIVVYDARGVVLHRNPAAADMLEQEIVGPLLEMEMHRMLRGVRDRAPREIRDFIDSGASGSGSRTVATAEGEIRLSLSRVGPGVVGPRPAILVVMDRDPDPEPLERIAMAAGLTKRQAQVAALLADRKTNLEIAHALRISPHTARHHTERVLLKLGVGSRRDVGPKLHGSESEAPEMRKEA